MNLYKDIVRIHEKHDQSYSDDEGYDLIDICQQHEDDVLPLLPLFFIARLMWEDGDSGIIHTTIGNCLETKELIMATMAIQIGWDVFEDYISEIYNYDDDDFYIDYLKRVYPEHRDGFWTDLYEMVLTTDDGPKGLFEMLIEVSYNTLKENEKSNN